MSVPCLGSLVGDVVQVVGYKDPNGDPVNVVDTHKWWHNGLVEDWE